MLTTAQLVKIYGDPGLKLAAPDPAWVKANIVTRQGANALPGVPSRFYFMTHRLVVERLERAFAAAQRAVPGHTIERAASFVFRRQRHDTPELAKAERRPLRPLSRHSWGVAVDIDAPENGAREFADGAKPQPWGPAWKKLWPNGLPRAFVEAFEGEGFLWGGRWDPFVDPMHFEVAA